jgi:hypothetical protein
MVAAWYASIYKAFLIASVIAFFIGFCSTGKTCLNSYLAGYSLLAVGILVLFVRLTQTPPSSMSVFLTTLFPFLLMLGILAILMYTILVNKDKIIHQQVSKDYYTFSNVTIILFLLQVYLVYSSISNANEPGRLSKTTSSFLYFLGTLSLMSTYILYNILMYFTTDGFVQRCR